MNHRPARNAIVAILGTPERTEGSLDDPREREENGIRFNEKWIYTHLTGDPAGVPMRVVYWMRYDFQGTVVRNREDEAWRMDAALAEAAARRSSRLPPLDPSHNPPVTPRVQYHPTSEPEGEPTLGGLIQEKSGLS
ncbi:MAG TPA: hypothetical protein VKT27_17150 [Candidatus Binataceae bacterium]|nr:hypothetical protein [Candidatus Binataceae bacterium]